MSQTCTPRRTRRARKSSARQAPRKAVYRIRNWPQYNQALVNRGSLTVWGDQAALDAWLYLRSLAETGVFRLKVIFGDHLASRKPEWRVTEAAIRGRALNVMTHLGRPQSERVA